jgi:uncharacterized membrane protein
MNPIRATTSNIPPEELMNNPNILKVLFFVVGIIVIVYPIAAVVELRAIHATQGFPETFAFGIAAFAGWMLSLAIAYQIKQDLKK